MFDGRPWHVTGTNRRQGLASTSPPWRISCAVVGSALPLPSLVRRRAVLRLSACARASVRPSVSLSTPCRCANACARALVSLCFASIVAHSGSPALRVAMLRPATPLTVLLVAAFGLLLLSSLSTPVIKAVPIATFQGVQFGVLGYCKSASDCKGPMVGYSTGTSSCIASCASASSLGTDCCPDGLFSTASDSDFDLPSSARHSLSSILIIHPVAALLTLALAGLAGAAHVHAPAHSPRYQLMLLILLFPTLLISLMAFLIDLLLFVPHLAWGGWLSLAATVIIGISSIVACAMRHTLVSRKARKRRVDENDGMNGQNYNDSRKPKVESSVFPRAESPPPLSAQSLSPDMKAPHLAAFDIKSTSDDTMPLYPRDPPVQTAGSVYSGQPAPPGRRPPRDQYGNPMPNDGYNGFAMQNEPMRTIPPMRGGPQGFARGRGYPPRGGYGPPRGGYRPPGGPPGMMVRGPPPPGWNGGRGGMAPPAMGPPMGRGQRGPPAGYDNCMYGQGQPPGPAPGPYGPPGPADPARGSPGAQNAYGQRGVSPPRADALQPPGPIGQAVEMDARAGIPPSNYGLRESDGDGQGMLALQQAGFQGGGGGTPPRHISAGVASPTRTYSQPEYAAPRAAWRAYV